MSRPNTTNIKCAKCSRVRHNRDQLSMDLDQRVAFMRASWDSAAQLEVDEMRGYCSRSRSGPRSVMHAWWSFWSTVRANGGVLVTSEGSSLGLGEWNSWIDRPRGWRRTCQRNSRPTQLYLLHYIPVECYFRTICAPHHLSSPTVPYTCRQSARRGPEALFQPTESQ